MRWPIQIQLLLPMLSVVVLAIALVSGANAYLGVVKARQSQEEDLRRVVATLLGERFPLTEPVLKQMSGLSGAEFVLLDEAGAVQAASVRIGPKELTQLRQLPSGKEPGVLAGSPSIELAGRSYLAQRVPVPERRPLPSAGSLAVLYPEDRWTATVRRAAYPGLIAGGVAVVAVILMTTALARRFVRPIHRLKDQTAGIARGDFTPVAVLPRDDEIRDLAVSINQMTERLSQYERDVRRNEQLRTLGQLGAGMAHQLRNAATGGRMAIELHQRQCAAPGDESLEVALRQLRLMESYLQRFLTLGRPRAAQRQNIALAAAIEDAVALVQPACRHAGIELTAIGQTAAFLDKSRQVGNLPHVGQVANLPSESTGRIADPSNQSGLCVCGDPEDLRQLLVNLLLNAVEATSRHGDAPARIVIDLERLDRDRVALRVKDSGPGPAAEVAGRLFEPFVTGKPDGTGLGLFVARQIVEDHGGTIRWERRDGLTCFTVELPLTKNGDRAADGS